MPPADDMLSLLLRLSSYSVAGGCLGRSPLSWITYSPGPAPHTALQACIHCDVLEFLDFQEIQLSPRHKNYIQFGFKAPAVFCDVAILQTNEKLELQLSVYNVGIKFALFHFL
jgi:hypothetical protein